MRTFFKVLAFGCIAASLFTACKKQEDPVVSRKAILQKYITGETQNFSKLNDKMVFQYDDQNRPYLITITSEGEDPAYCMIDYVDERAIRLEINVLTDPEDPSTTTDHYFFNLTDNRADSGGNQDLSALQGTTIYLFEYDSKGHLCKFTHKIDGSDYIYFFKWKNGDLIKAYSADESFIYEYTPGDDAYAGVLPLSAYPHFLPQPLIASFGYYGKAPKHMPRKLVYTDKMNAFKGVCEYSYGIMGGLMFDYTEKLTVGDTEKITYGKTDWSWVN